MSDERAVMGEQMTTSVTTASKRSCRRVCVRPGCGATFTVQYPSNPKRFCTRTCADALRQPPPGGKRKLDADRRLDVVRRYRGGESPQALGREVGVSKQTVINWSWETGKLDGALHPTRQERQARAAQLRAKQEKESRAMNTRQQQDAAAQNIHGASQELARRGPVRLNARQRERLRGIVQTLQDFLIGDERYAAQQGIERPE